MTRRFAALVFTSAITARAAAAPASADATAPDARGVTVVAEGCDALNLRELERLTVLELSSVVDASRTRARYDIGVFCGGGSVRLTITDPLTQKTLARVVEAPAGPEPERVLALAVAELYRASWLELMTRDSPDAARESEPNAAERRALDAALGAVPRRQPTQQIGVAGGVRVRALDDVVWLPSIEVTYTDWLSGSFGVAAHASAELGTAHRDAGDVDMRLLHLGLQATARSREYGVFSLQGRGGVAATEVHMAGRPGLAGARGASIDGVRPELFAVVAPAIAVGPLLLALEAEAGFLPRAPQGSVPAGPAVRVDGPWVGALLSVSVGTPWL